MPPLTGAARVFAVTYLAFQAGSVAAFWLLLWLVPALRAPFLPADVQPRMLATLALADGVFLPITSAAAVWSLLRPSRWTPHVLWLHAGAAVYAGLFAIGLWVVDRSLWLGAGLMIPVLVTPPAIAWAASSKRGTEPSVRAALGRTLLQVVVFWFFFLAVLPAAIGVAARAAELPSFGGSEAAGWAIFALGSVLGLWSAWSMASVGRGTPLPLDPPHRLVIAGPYAFVRNPMAIAGLAQGLAVAIGAGSWALVAYVLFGALAWQFAIRPQEERELAERFGPAYREYLASVRCWWPRLAAYRGTSELTPAD
jgi:protein-S-isoprenylcysteine O-methyltransferase Ste14